MTDTPHAPTQPPTAPAPKPAQPRAPSVPLLVGIVALVILIGLGLYLTLAGQYDQRTDDAYVEAHVMSTIPKVPAYVQALHVDDNSPVRAGELLVELDPRDYQAQVAIAQANLAAAQGRLGEAQQAVAVAVSTIGQNAAEMKVAQANATLATINLSRLRAVADSRAVSSQRIDEGVAAANGTRASLDAAQVKVKTSQTQADLARAQAKTALASVQQAQAQLAQAQLNLSYTHIYANEDGSVANRNVEPGDYVQPGQLLFSVVPNRVFVIANFKETQLTHVRPGQAASVTVDAFPGQRFEGHVDSLQRGTGSRFALLPPENATGNFVKVVQRVPVKIVLDRPAQALHLISPGMSVEARIEIGRRPAWLGGN